MDQSPQKNNTAGLIYSETVYWLTLASSVVVIAGITIMFVFPNNFLEPEYLYSAILSGEPPRDIWHNEQGFIPLADLGPGNILQGDILTLIGLLLGVFSVVPATLMSAVILYRQDEKFFTVLAIISCLLILLPGIGLFWA